MHAGAPQAKLQVGEGEVMVGAVSTQLGQSSAKFTELPNRAELKHSPPCPDPLVGRTDQRLRWGALGFCFAGGAKARQTPHPLLQQGSSPHLYLHEFDKLPLGGLKDGTGLSALVGPEGAVTTH